MWSNESRASLQMAANAVQNATACADERSVAPVVLPACVAALVLLIAAWLWFEWRRSKYYNAGDIPGPLAHQRRVIGWVLFVLRDLLLFWLPYE